MVECVQLYRAYDTVKRVVQNDYGSVESSRAVIDLTAIALQFLREDCEQIALQSVVAGKEYISFLRNGVVARPANRAYFAADPDEIAGCWRRWQSGGDVDADRLARALYTIALAPCLAFDLCNRNDKKRPATYFECMVGHIFAKSLNLKPITSATLQMSGRSVRMTMDFLFENDGDAPNIHLPVKMSTRERVVQVWAHQRLLDGAYGIGSYKGILVAFAETKLDVRKREVTEICVPDQWLAYQALLAKMERIYYFDIPVRYQELTNAFPTAISIRPLRAFFTEIANVAGR